MIYILKTMGAKYCGIYIYGDRSISLLVYDHQDTESKSQGMEIGEAGPICTYR